VLWSVIVKMSYSWNCIGIYYVIINIIIIIMCSCKRYVFSTAPISIPNYGFAISNEPKFAQIIIMISVAFKICKIYVGTYPHIATKTCIYNTATMQRENAMWVGHRRNNRTCEYTSICHAVSRPSRMLYYAIIILYYIPIHVGYIFTWHVKLCVNGKNLNRYNIIKNIIFFVYLSRPNT